MAFSEVNIHSVVDLVVTTLDAKDPTTFEHSYRVAELTEWLADAMNLPRSRREALHIAAHLHDIGKVGVSDPVLNKVGPLSEDEKLQLQSHSVIGFNILNRLPSLARLARFVRHHHERWDGLGYPDGLAGESIPLESRIIALADSLDAMTSNRPYRYRKTYEWALQEVQDHAGSQFCPKCVEILLSRKAELKILLYHSRQQAQERHNAYVGHEELMHSRRVATQDGFLEEAPSTWLSESA